MNRGILFLLVFLFPIISLAENDKLPLPRFVSIRSDEANVRTGPGVRYPIKWVIKKQNMPTEIIAEYEDWRKIRDIELAEGWVHKAMLSGKRTAIVKFNKIKIFAEPKSKSKVVALSNKGTQLIVDKCDGDYCEVEAGGVDGYINQNNLWGVYEGEEIKD
jgi:SH3-like domain-containing protein